MQSKACFAVIKAICADNRTGNRVANAVGHDSRNVTCRRFELRCTDTGTNIWLERTVAIEIVERVDHQIPRLHVAVFVSGIDNLFIHANQSWWYSAAAIDTITDQK